MNAELIEFPAGPHFITQPLVIDEPGTRVVVHPRAVLDLSALDGPGIAGLHNTSEAVGAFDVRADHVTVELHGRLTSSAPQHNGRQVCGILITQAAHVAVRGSGEIDGCYNAIWPAKGASHVVIDGLHLHHCSHNLKIGSDELVSTPSEVVGIEVRGLLSDESINDGLKTAAHVEGLRVVGGQYENNARDGIDLYVGGKDCTIDAAILRHNGLHGLDGKWHQHTGSHQGQGGHNRRVTVANCHAYGNGRSGIKITGDSAEVLPEDWILTGNHLTANAHHGLDLTARFVSVSANHAKWNGRRGFNVAACEYVTLQGNLAQDNCHDGATTEGYSFGTDASGRPCRRILATVNRAIGGQFQKHGFASAAHTLQASTIADNHADGHLIDFAFPAAFNSGDVILRDNA